MRLILIFVLGLGLGCGDREKPVSVEPAGKATTDCSLADILAGRCGDTADPTLDEVPENYVPPSPPSAPSDSTEAAVTDSTGAGDAGGDTDAGDDGDAGDDTGSDEPAAEEPVVVVEEPEVEEPVERTVFERACDEIGRSAVRLAELSAPHGGSRYSSVSLERGASLEPSGAYGRVALSSYNRPGSDGEFNLSGSLSLVGSRGVSSGVVTVYEAGNSGQALYLLGVSFRVRHARSDFEVYDGHCGDLGTLVLKKIITGSFNLLNLLSRDAQWAFEDYQDVPTGSGQGRLDYNFTGRLGRRIEYGSRGYSWRGRSYHSYYYDNRSSIGVYGTAYATYEEAKPFPVGVSGSFEINPRNVLGTLLFPNPGPWPNSIPDMSSLAISVYVDAYFYNRKAVSPSGTVSLNTIRSQIGPIQNHSDTDFENAAMDTVFVSAGIE